MVNFKNHLSDKFILQIIIYLYRSFISDKHPIYGVRENQLGTQGSPLFLPTSQLLQKTNDLSQESEIFLQPVKFLQAISLPDHDFSSTCDCAEHKLFHFLSSCAANSLVNSILSNFPPSYTHSFSPLLPPLFVQFQSNYLKEYLTLSSVYKSPKRP